MKIKCEECGKSFHFLEPHLAEECIERHGVEVLEGTINRRLLEQAIRGKNLTVTEQDVEHEIARAGVLRDAEDSLGGAPTAHVRQRVPRLDELKAAGLLEGQIPAGFHVPMPDDRPGSGPDEDPLEHYLEVDFAGFRRSVRAPTVC